MMPAIVIFCLCLGFALIEDDANRPLMGVLSILTKEIHSGEGLWQVG